MPIEFSCPECAALIRTPDGTAGKKGKCPSCTAIVRIPGGATPPSKPTAPPAPSAQPASEQVETGPLEFFCSVCGQIVRTPRSAAGKKGKCPHCNGVIQIPLKSRTVKGPAAAPAPTAAPKPTPKPKPKVVEEIGLAAEDDLAPLPEAPKPKPAPKPVVNQPPPPVHKPKNPHIPPSESFLQPTSDPFEDLPPLAGDPFSPASGLAPDPFGTSTGGGVSLPAGSPFAPVGGGPGPVPGGPPGPRKPIAPIMVILPAIFQLVSIVPFLLFNMFVISSMVYTFMVAGAGGALLSADSVTKLVFYSMGLLFVFAMQIWAIFGSINMLQFRNYDNAVASAYVSLIPCFGFCGLPFGIWSLIVLNDRGVKKMFTDS